MLHGFSNAAMLQCYTVPAMLQCCNAAMPHDASKWMQMDVQQMELYGHSSSNLVNTLHLTVCALGVCTPDCMCTWSYAC